MLYSEEPPVEVYDRNIHVTIEDLARGLGINVDAAKARLIKKEEAGIAVRVWVVMPTGFRRYAWKMAK